VSRGRSAKSLKAVDSDRLHRGFSKNIEKFLKSREASKLQRKVENGDNPSTKPLPPKYPMRKANIESNRANFKNDYVNNKSRDASHARLL